MSYWIQPVGSGDAKRLFVGGHGHDLSAMSWRNETDFTVSQPQRYTEGALILDISPSATCIFDLTITTR